MGGNRKEISLKPKTIKCQFALTQTGILILCKIKKRANTLKIKY